MIIERSGRFDEDWYRGQIDVPAGSDALGHYLTVGSALGLEPHPLFSAPYYELKSRAARDSYLDPFAHFLEVGAVEAVDPHPLFTTARHVERHPESVRFPGGPWGHRLDVAPPDDLAALGLSQVGVPAGPAPGYVEVVRRASRAHRAVPDHTAAPRDFTTFDRQAGSEYVARMRAVVEALDDPPLVSIVMPTHDRAEQTITAIESVIRQSYERWELIVVDDASTDETPHRVADIAASDERIRLITRDVNGGVAAARNTGIEHSSGRFLAYLDSDNTWVPEFLEVMVGHLLSRGASAGYCASELSGHGKLLYRGREMDEAVLRERNFIDCITLVHERSLLDVVGPFDASLRRVVDWDLLIRLSSVTKLVYAPFIGTSYDLWDDRTERITHDESRGYRYVVRQRALIDWDSAPPVVAGVTSILIALSDGLGPLVRTLRATCDSSTIELVAVDMDSDVRTAHKLRALEVLHPQLRVTRVVDDVSEVLALNVAASAARGETLLVLDHHVDADVPALVANLSREVLAGAAIASPPLILGSGVIHSAGRISLPPDGFVRLGYGLPEHEPTLQEVAEVPTVEPFAMAIDAMKLRSLGGFNPVFIRGGWELDLTARVWGAGWSVLYVPGVPVLLSKQVPEDRWVPNRADLRELGRRHPPGSESGSMSPPDVGRLAHVRGSHVDSIVGVYAPVHVRDPERGRRWAIKCGAPSVSDRESWGDWHFAMALRDALRRRGHKEVVVDCAQAWYRSTAWMDDIVIHLRGTRHYRPNPTQTNLLWIISHPENVRPDELRPFDAVAVASIRFAETVQSWLAGSVPVEVLQQCTDTSRFRTGVPKSPHEVLFVGNSRRTVRPLVAAVAAARDIQLEIFGADWEGLVPGDRIAGHYLPNEGLAGHYAGARIVLNDHWDDMRRFGFVSNRIFDALASGAEVLTDDVADLRTVLPDFPSLHVIHDDAVAPDAVRRILADPTPRPVREDVAAVIRAEHSFDARAAQLEQLVNEVVGHQRLAG